MILTIAQVFVSVTIIGLVLVQERSGGLGGIFGGSGGDGGFYQARRGLERVVFTATVLGTGVFAALALLNLLIQ